MQINSRGTARFTTIVAMLFFSAVVAACGGKQSVASKSAAALREAQQKGLPMSGDAHGGHSASGPEVSASTTERMDHSTMTGMDHATMTGMDHSNMPGMKSGGEAGMAGMDHSNMPGMKDGTQPGMAGMDQSNVQQGGMAGMQHGSTGTAANLIVSAPRSNGEIARLAPKATLTPDEFDAPAPIAVSEAAKASGGGMSHSAPNQESTSTPQPVTGHGEHAQPASPPPSKPQASSGRAPVSERSVVYTCPLHPEVTSASPGRCPKCGMTLVKKNN
jgi:hypothetical protein